MAKQAQHSRLFEPIRVGQNILSNRVALAPLTRFRANDQHVPIVNLVKEYYTQRASYKGTLLITEATFISARAGGYRNAPGIWNEDQIAAWKEIVKGVHAAGGVIFLQLWALGRAAKQSVLDEEGLGPVEAPSALQFDSNNAIPRELTEQDIEEYIRDYAQAARNAVHGAGFDGVEIHNANGYLPDQFLQDTSNIRTDRWGGSIPNRARFSIEVTKAVVAAVGADKTAIRISPFNLIQGMGMKDAAPQFTYLLEQIKGLGLAYLHIVETRIAGVTDTVTEHTIDDVVNVWAGHSPIVIAGGYKAEEAQRLVDEHQKDKDVIVAFGRYFIANPDLVYRIEQGIEFSQYNRGTFYTAKSPKGYIDYPFSDTWQRDSKI